MRCKQNWIPILCKKGSCTADDIDNPVERREGQRAGCSTSNFTSRDSNIRRRNNNTEGPLKRGHGCSSSPCRPKAHLSSSPVSTSHLDSNWATLKCMSNFLSSSVIQFHGRTATLSSVVAGPLRLTTSRQKNIGTWLIWLYNGHPVPPNPDVAKAWKRETRAF